MKNLVNFFICLSLLGGMSSCKFDEINQTESDNQKEIEGYMSRSNLKLQKSPEGMYYSINSANSSGKQAFNTDLVKFYYKITCLFSEFRSNSSRNKLNNSCEEYVLNL